MNKKYIQALILICAILIMGVIGGIAGSTIYHKQVRKERFAHRDSGHRGMGRMFHLSRALDLNPQQFEAIRADWDIASREIEKLQKEIKPLFEKVHLQMREAIETHLQPAQLEVFREMTKLREEQRFRGGPDYRRGPGFRGDPRLNEDRKHPDPLQKAEKPKVE